MNLKKILYYVLVPVLLLAVFFLYKNNNPYTSTFFPQCPFRWLTGLQCAGCGSQRAIHYLLNANFKAAWHENPMLLIAIPYILLGWLFELIKPTQPKMLKLRQSLYGHRAILLIFISIIAFWVLRNC